MPGVAHLLQGLGQYGHVEGAGREAVEIVVGVALHHGEAPGQAGRDPVGGNLQSLAVDAPLPGQEVQKVTLAAADVQYPRPDRGQAQDLAEVLAHWPVHVSPRFSAAEARKPRRAESRAGSSRKMASCPLSVLISTKLARQPAALRARTTCRLSAVE